MATHWRSRLRDDDGISLVEIMVSIVILGIALTAFAGTITQALATITGDEQFVRGNQAAADLVEESRAQAWECIGLDDSAPGWTTTGANGPMVAMDTGCTAQPVNLPSHTVTVDGQAYDVTREVVWVDDAGVPGTENHKRITVTLDWTVRDRVYTATQESLRVPTPDEVAVVPLGSPSPSPSPTPPPTTACSGRILSMTISPANVAITPYGLTAEAISVVVETCPGTSGVTLAGVTSADQLTTRPMVANPTGSDTRWVVNLPKGTPNFIEGTKNWRALAQGSVPEAERTATRQIRFFRDNNLPAVIIVSSTVSPSFCVNNNGDLLRSSTVTIVVENITQQSDGRVDIGFKKNEAIPATFVSSDGVSRSTWRVTLNAPYRVGKNNVTMYVNAERLVDNARAAESQTNPSIAERSEASACPA